MMDVHQTATMQVEPCNRVTTQELSSGPLDGQRPTTSNRKTNHLLLASCDMINSRYKSKIPMFLLANKGWSYVGSRVEVNSASNIDQERPAELNGFVDLRCINCKVILSFAPSEFTPELVNAAHLEGCTYRTAARTENDSAKLLTEANSEPSGRQLDLLQNVHLPARNQRETDATASANFSPAVVSLDNYSTTAGLVFLKTERACCSVFDFGAERDMYCPEMRRTIERINSFLCGNTWLRSSLALALANLGLFFPLEQNVHCDKVRCAFCHFEKSNWLSASVDRDDTQIACDFAAWHRKSALCPFVLGFEMQAEADEQSMSFSQLLQSDLTFSVAHRQALEAASASSFSPDVADASSHDVSSLQVIFNSALPSVIAGPSSDMTDGDEPLLDVLLSEFVGNWSTYSLQANPYVDVVKAYQRYPLTYECFCSNEMRLATFSRPVLSATSLDKDLLLRLKSTGLRIGSQCWDDIRLASPRKVAAAGFFTTLKDNEVHCFSCGLKLDRELLARHDPWQAHCAGNPQCPFLLTTKGKRFVQQVIDSQANAEESSPFPARFRDVDVHMSLKLKLLYYALYNANSQVDHPIIRTLCESQATADESSPFLARFRDVTYLKLLDYALYYVDSQVDRPIIRTLCERQLMDCSLANVRVAILLRMYTPGLSFDNALELVEAVRCLLHKLQETNGALSEQHNSMDDVLMCKGCLCSFVEVQLRKCNHFLCFGCSQQSLCRLCSLHVSSVGRIVL